MTPQWDLSRGGMSPPTWMRWSDWLCGEPTICCSTSPKPRSSLSTSEGKGGHNAPKHCRLPSPNTRKTAQSMPKKAHNIIKDNSHPGHSLFELLPSHTRYTALKNKLIQLRSRTQFLFRRFYWFFFYMVQRSDGTITMTINIFPLLLYSACDALHMEDKGVLFRPALTHIYKKKGKAISSACK